jgi:hypothetical protein
MSHGRALVFGSVLSSRCLATATASHPVVYESMRMSKSLGTPTTKLGVVTEDVDAWTWRAVKGPRFQ